MVKICPSYYPSENEIKYKDYFKKYPYKLSPFQKYSIEATVEGHHTLITAHTGSGKTLPAEFAIEYFVNQGKKVIYTAPIKALSNQKFYEFTKKYKHISFGILTGDIKCNPEANVLIMTTEILLNTLYNKKMSEFKMDFNNELGCVIFDEIHYINDLDRGRIWEESIMLLPNQIQLIMLSATIDKPENFALWCEKIKGNNKIVYLSSTNERIIPLTHYSFITLPVSIIKTITDKTIKKQINDSINNLYVIKKPNNEFNQEGYNKIKDYLQLTKKFQIKKKSFVLNQLCEFMVNNNMLPALCFVFSRKQLENFANEIFFPLQTENIHHIKKECEHIIKKLPNYKEYIDLPEYTNMIKLLEKGIAIHHSGCLPVIKEIIEILYGKGYIKLLFATETFSIGVNMPTKTVIFTDINKFDGNSLRNLFPHEYTQMAGRAGRRGIDKIGNVIHLNNLFRKIDETNYKKILCGKPQELKSKFKLSYNTILNLINIEELINIEDLINYTNKSLYYFDNKINENDIDKILQYLIENNFIINNTLSDKGVIASNIREVNCLIFANLLHNKELNGLSSTELVGLFSCFTSIGVSEDNKLEFPICENKKLKEFILYVTELYNKMQEEETQLMIDSGTDYYKHYDLINHIIEWCNCNDIETCKLVLKRMEVEKGIFLGEFVKAILKINNISNELEKIAELTNNISLLSKLREIPLLTLKYVATNQSLYI
jgi:superfamily II RNA helicase